jgi:hypothetical protein
MQKNCSYHSAYLLLRQLRGAGFLLLPSEGARHYYRRSATACQLFSSTPPLPPLAEAAHKGAPAVRLPYRDVVLVSARPSAAVSQSVQHDLGKVNVCRGRLNIDALHVVWSDIWTASLANE